MRKSALLIAVLSGASFFLRRSRRFGPISAMVLGAVLEQVVVRLREPSEPKGKAAKPSLWTLLTKKSPPSRM
jgi:hypothetical protein